MSRSDDAGLRQAPGRFVQYPERVREQLPEENDETLETMMIIMGTIRLSHLATTDADRLVHRPLGLTFSRFRILFALCTIGTMTAVELADIFDKAKPTISKMLRPLQQQGLVTRKPHPTDKRAALVEITPAGRQLMEEARTQQSAFEQQLLRHLSSDQRHQLADLLSLAITQDQPENAISEL